MKPDRRLPNELLQVLINYLANRPYHEVYQFIPALDSLPVISQPMTPAPDAKETTEPAGA